MKNTYRSILVVVALAIFSVSTVSVQAEDYLYETDNGTITITRYIGPGGDVIIPGEINGLPVVGIGGAGFSGCTSLTTLTIPNGVTTIGWGTFWNCANLTSVYCKGNTPEYPGSGALPLPFNEATNAVLYYLPGTIGWEATYAGRPTAPWVLPYPVILTTAPNFGIQTNAFGFRISWATNATVVVEASSALANRVWPPVSTNTLTNGWSYFSDAEWTNYPARFYRVRSQ